MITSNRFWLTNINILYLYYNYCDYIILANLKFILIKVKVGRITITDIRSIKYTAYIIYILISSADTCVSVHLDLILAASWTNHAHIRSNRYSVSCLSQRALICSSKRSADARARVLHSTTCHNTHGLISARCQGQLRSRRVWCVRHGKSGWGRLVDAG